MSWDVLRKQAVDLENEVDSKLVTFSKLSDGDGQVFEIMCIELRNFLQQLNEVNDELSSFANNSSAGNSTAVLHTIQRHREVLTTLNREFMNTTNSVRQKLNRHSLLGDVQREINESKTNGEYYLQESRRAQEAQQNADGNLSTAINMYEQLVGEGQRLRSNNQTLSGIAEKIPGLNNLMRRIGVRKQRDQLIIAGVIGSCIFVSTIYLFS